MKALLIGSLFVILLIIGGAVVFMIIDSANTIDAQVVVKSNISNPKKTITNNIINNANQSNSSVTTSNNTKTNISAKDALDDYKAAEPIINVPNTSKIGFTIDYTVSQNTCDDLIDILKDEVSDAEEEVTDAKNALDKEQRKLNAVENGDKIEEIQEEVKDKKKELTRAENTLFEAREKLIKARTTCKS